MLQWELLVTDGHVRAARWRNAVLWMFAVAVLAIVAGIAITLFLPKPTPSTRVAEAKAAYVASERAAVSRFLQEHTNVTAPIANADRAFKREDAATSIKAIGEALNASGRVPETVSVQRSQDFWSSPWEAGKFHAIEDGRTIFVGAFVDVGMRAARGQPQPVLQRTFGLFRKGANGKWTFHCLQMFGAAPCEGQGLDPSTIPETMRGIIPASAYRQEGQS